MCQKLRRNLLNMDLKKWLPTTILRAFQELLQKKKKNCYNFYIPANSKNEFI